jgi:hypothetical protein
VSQLFNQLRANCSLSRQRWFVLFRLRPNNVSSCQHGSKPSLRLVLKIDRHPILRLTPRKLAVQGRYTPTLCLWVSSCSLQGIAERPLPSFTAVTRVQIPSGTPNLFIDLRQRPMAGIQDAARLSSRYAKRVAAIRATWLTTSGGRTIPRGRAFLISSAVGDMKSFSM